MLNKNFEIFVIHIVALETLLLGLLIYSNKEAQIAFCLQTKLQVQTNIPILLMSFQKKSFGATRAN